MNFIEWVAIIFFGLLGLAMVFAVLYFTVGVLIGFDRLTDFIDHITAVGIIGLIRNRKSR